MPFDSMNNTGRALPLQLLKTVAVTAFAATFHIGLCLLNPAPLAAQLVPVSQEAMLPADYPLVTKPLQCLAAVTREHQLIWRNGERDTMVTGTVSDTLPTEVVLRARQCAAQFSLATLTAGHEVNGLTNRDIFPLLRLYLLVGWDDSVRTAIGPLIENSSLNAPDSTTRRDIVLRRIVEAYRAARPLRLSDAQYYADQLDLLGTPAAVSRLRAHAQLAETSLTIGDSAGVVRHMRAALAAASDIPGRNRALEYTWIRSVYYSAINVADVTKDSVLGEQVMESMSRLLESLLTSEPELPDSLRTYLSQQLLTLRGYLSAGYESSRGIYRQIKPVSAEHWFSEDGKPIPPVDSSVPTLVLKINPHRCNGVFCERAFAALNRLAKEFQPRGVQVVLLVSTAGYLHLDVFDNIAQEVQAIRTYVQDTLKLPGVLAISESEFVTKADGRIQQVPQGNESYSLNWFVLRDGSGNSHTRAFGFLSDRQESESWVRVALERMLAQQND